MVEGFVFICSLGKVTWARCLLARSCMVVAKMESSWPLRVHHTSAVVTARNSFSCVSSLSLATTPAACLSSSLARRPSYAPTAPPSAPALECRHAGLARPLSALWGSSSVQKFLFPVHAHAPKHAAFIRPTSRVAMSLTLTSNYKHNARPGLECGSRDDPHERLSQIAHRPPVPLGRHTFLRRRRIAGR